jgi:NADH:ubiquinone oxidoreductase subunit K
LKSFAQQNTNLNPPTLTKLRLIIILRKSLKRKNILEILFGIELSVTSIIVASLTICTFLNQAEAEEEHEYPK